MFERFTDRARKAMRLAEQEAERLSHKYVGPVHILMGLVKEGSGIGANVLRNMDIDLGKVRLEVEKMVKAGPLLYLARTPLSPQAEIVVNCAIEESTSLNHAYVDTEHLLLGLLRDKENMAAQVLMNLGLTLEDVRQKTLNLLGAVGDPGHESEAAAARARSRRKTPVLNSCSRDLTELAAKGSLNPVIGRSSEIERLIQILCRRDKNNPVLLGESGVGKATIIEGLAQMIVANSVPKLLADRRIVVLDLAMIAAGTDRRDQIGENIKAIVNEVRSTKNALLVIEEVRVLTHAGSAELFFNATEVLKPAISRGEIQCICTTTVHSHRKYVAQDAGLAHRFEPMHIKPPTSDQAIEILKGLRDSYEAHHRAKITDGALFAAVELAMFYLPATPLPGSALQILDDAGGRVELAGMAKPPDFTDLEEQIDRLSIDKDEAVKAADYERAAELREEVSELRQKKEQLQREWRIYAEKASVVDEDVVAQVVSDTTGLALADVVSRTVPPAGSSPTGMAHGHTGFERHRTDKLLPGRGVVIEPHTGFVLMPHNADFRGVFDVAIAPAMVANGITPGVAEDIRKPGVILDQVWTSIRTAEVLIADVSGLNANVIFELGLCYGVGRSPILLTRDPKGMPFNLQPFRYIEYENTSGGAEQLRIKLSVAIKDFLEAAREEPEDDGGVAEPT